MPPTQQAQESGRGTIPRAHSIAVDERMFEKSAKTAQNTRNTYFPRRFPTHPFQVDK